jgi:hypothetical protein
MNKKVKYVTMVILLCCAWLLSPGTPGLLLSENTTARAASALWDGSVATGFAGGTGTEADPYLISNGAQLAYFSRQVNNDKNSYNNKYIKLTQDILLNEMNPDGTFVSASPSELFTRDWRQRQDMNNFNGHFDGNGKKIIGLYINIPGWIYYGGLFGYAGSESVIQNVSISGAVNGGYETGVIAGYTDGVITGCDISCTVTGVETYTGGITGSAGANSVISNCTVAGAVNGGRDYVGGVAGQTQGVITECYISSTVTGAKNTGGIAGSAGADSEINNCTVSGTVDGRENVGGVAGQTQGVITGCSSSGTVTGIDFYVGGVVGYAGTGSEVSACSNTGPVTGRSDVGGVAGYTDGVITVCVNSGAVTGIDFRIGGVAGYADSHNTVSNCLNKGAVTATSDPVTGEEGASNGIGGIVGVGNWSDPASTINNNLNLGSVTGNANVEGKINVGGIIGISEYPLTTEDAWNNYYSNAPAGTGGGDVWAEDGAVPFGDMTWEEVIEELNSDNPAGDDIWSEDEEGTPVPGGSAPDAAVEILNAIIKEGRYYTAALLGDGVAATITADSVFTTAFCVGYNESINLETQTLGLAEEGTVVPLPANTSVIMLVDGVYYYKNLSSELDTRLALSEFIKMGSTTDNYTPAAPAPAETTKDYLFIFDFSKTAPGVATGTYKVELLPTSGAVSGTMPSVTVAGVNTYTLTAGGENGFVDNINFSSTLVEGYDYKTEGKNYAFELQLAQDGAVVPFPVGTKINGTIMTSNLPYAFTAAVFGDNAVTIDMSGCVNPLVAGSYDLQVRAYASEAVASPREGYMLASGATTLAVEAPVQYAIRVNAPTRVFDESSESIPVVYNIETLGAGTVKSTLQRKYGPVYVNISSQKDLPVSISAGSATLTIPAGYDKGTYRFLFTLYDNNGASRAQNAESLIIK